MIKWKSYTGRAMRLTPKEIGRADPEAGVTIAVRPQPDGTWMVAAVGTDTGMPFGGNVVAFVDAKSEIQEAVYQQLRMLDKMAGSGGDLADSSRHRSGPKFDKLRAWTRSLQDGSNVQASNVADRYMKKAGLTKTAGEVRFIKDRGGDKNEWGWGSPGPTEREIQEDFEFNPKNLKPLAATLRAGLLAMGHALSAHAVFNRIKSAQVSPDGSLGGKGYIQKIPDMRRQLMNVCEALSSVTDTLYDEIKAPHWDPAKETQGRRERDEVKNILNDVDEIRSDPEGFAENQESEMDEDGSVSVSEDSGGAVSEGGQGSSGKYARQKLASMNPMSVRVAARYLELTQSDK